jgi:hypothetical protein
VTLALSGVITESHNLQPKHVAKCRPVPAACQVRKIGTDHVIHLPAELAQVDAELRPAVAARHGVSD